MSASLEAAHLLPVYQRHDIVLDHGHGCWIHDTSGRPYLDFITGIGVNALGYNHPRITKVISEQAARCLHTSNLFYHPYQGPLAARLAQWSGLDRAFFSNSGTEAVEAALKLTRLYAPHRHHIIALENSFHGRTCGALSITGQPKYRHAFSPLLPGVTFLPANDIDQLRRAFTSSTAAIFTETVQGEGGIHPLSESFLREVRALASSHRALWVADETQCGLGRTGHYFAYQRFPNLLPDIVVTAKPLAAGLPLGATLFREEVAQSISPGLHGTTFGGGPLACRVALETLDIIDELLPNIRATAAYFHHALHQLAANHPLIREVRTAGLMAGIELHIPGAPIVDQARAAGLLINCTHQTVLRLLPPFLITAAEVDHAIEILSAVLAAQPAAEPALCSE